MQPITIVLYGLVFLTAIFVVSAISGFLRVASGSDDQAVERRLTQKIDIRGSGNAKYQVVLPRFVTAAWEQYIPFLTQFRRLVRTSGTGITVSRALANMAAITLVLCIPAAIFIPPVLLPIGIMLAAIIGTGVVLMYLTSARSSRNAKFEEQLPDAIDLIVRSLKVGHPLSGAIGVVGRELPAPIGPEFAAAFEEATYGHDVPAALMKMSERVDVADLGYFAMAVQIQQESGGNLVESLAKLSTIIRERFRMFRKVTAMTAEGRFSAWFLSVFPLAMIGVIQMIKADYYVSVMDFAYFPHLVGATLILLVVNVIAMRIITSLKV